MLIAATANKGLVYNRVLFDSWYATKNLMLLVESFGKIFYCPIHCNRLVDDSQGLSSYRRVDSLIWDAVDEHRGKQIKINGFLKYYKVKLFRVVASDSRTDWVVTNDSGRITTEGTQKACALRWKIEQLHRELKQLTGIEKCQCRKAGIQRNNIACAVLVWIHLKKPASRAETTVYQLKETMLVGLSSERVTKSIHVYGVCVSPAAVEIEPGLQFGVQRLLFRKLCPRRLHHGTY